MNIIHVLSSFGLGGQERVALDLAVGQKADGHRPIAITLEPGDPGPVGQEFRDAGVEVRHLPKRPGFDVRLAFQLGDLFRREHADVVHTHNPQPLIYSGVGARLNRAALVHTKHGMNPDTSRRVRLRQAAAKLVDAFVAVSEPTAEHARETGECAPSKLHTIPNGIDLSRFGGTDDAEARAAVRKELGISPDSWVVGTVGRLWPEKGHPYMLRSLEPLLGPSFHVLIAGDGPDAKEMAEFVANLRVPESVHLLGPRLDIPRVLAALDTFVLSSVREGLPLVIPEAMAAGLPVVSTAVGGIPGVVEEGRTGFLVEYNDEEGMRDRIAALDADRKMAKECGIRGRTAALERYSSQRMVRDYMDLYEEIRRR